MLDIDLDYCEELLHPKFSAWVRFYCHADDRSFLTMTAFTKNAFNKLERAVFPPDAARIKSVGRPELIDNRGKVGLYLFLQLAEWKLSIYVYYLGLFLLLILSILMK